MEWMRVYKHFGGMLHPLVLAVRRSNRILTRFFPATLPLVVQMLVYPKLLG
jgi:hypothetical protein